MKDKYILLIAVINIIVLTFVMAFISDSRKEKPKKEEPIPEPIVINEVKGTKVCNLEIATGNNNVTNTNRLVINYTNDIITDYSIDYYLSYNGNKKATNLFNKYKNDYNTLLESYQNKEDYIISNYFNENFDFKFTITHNINNESDSYLLFGPNVNVNDAVELVTNQGYICE